MTGTPASRKATLPNEPLFQRMLEHATARPEDIVIADKGLGVEANYLKIFTDVLHMRDILQAQAPAPANHVDSFISILIPINYEFIVSVLACLAAGRAFAPLRFGYNAEHTLGSIVHCRSTCLIYDADETDFAAEIQRLATASGHHLDIIPFEFPHTPPPTELSDLRVCLGTETPASAESPAMVTFSTGTTGLKPKAIAHSRRVFNRPWRLPPQAVFLLVADPFHLISYLNTMTAPLVGGCKLQIIPGEGSAAEFWEQVRFGHITSFSALPCVWEEIAWYYRNHISPLPLDIRESYLSGARRIVYPYSMGLITPPPVLNFWRGVGQPLLNAFGTTELGGLALSTSKETESDHYRCIGKPSPGVQVKLSEGDHGELMIKSPNAMIGYFDDPERTKSAYDEDGFYRTGDAASLLPNGEYVYEGRINKPTKDPIILCEGGISRLSFVEQVTGAMIPFAHEYGTHIVGVVVRLKQDLTSHEDRDENALAKPLRRLSITAHGLYLQLDAMIPVAVRVLGPNNSEGSGVLKPEDVEGFFPYDKKPSFRAEIEYAVHRVCLN
ncbi:acetyl-CoA synthetase-like protein [Aspergillus californicus]